MTNKALMKKLAGYKAQNNRYPNCYVCGKEIEPETNFEYVKQKSGSQIFIHTSCFERHFLKK